METWLMQWLSLLLRWAHFITGIAWIGASFYFNWLENHLQRRADGEREQDPIAGDLWAIHGGGFYYLQKYRVAPDHMPSALHWFKYEAYFTWLSGMALLGAIYYWNARLYLLDPVATSISAGPAIAISLGSLLASWLAYDGLCRSPLRSKPLLISLLILAWFALLAFVLCHLLSGRAAYIHIGAAIGTVMVANVFFVIIPAQKELVNALIEGRAPQARQGQNALQRSRHNNYLTLPVLFVMISGHYPGTYGSPYGWLILVVFSLASVGIRHWFNVRHLPAYNRWILPLALLLLASLVLATMPSLPRPLQIAAAVSTTNIMPLIRHRCAGCHASQPTLAGFTQPPLGLTFDSEELVEAQAQRIFQSAVTTRTMPLGDLTGMTEEERELLARWYAGLPDSSPGPNP
ncbi:MAG: urate hydroxylase PuuD [Lysobacterales bacterium]